MACSNSGGFIGAEMKAAGWDMVIFEGKSPSPVYLYLENDKAQLLPADDLWGKSLINKACPKRMLKFRFSSLARKL